MGPRVRGDDAGVCRALSHLTSSARRRRLPQALPAQTILALERHRQLCRLLRAPAASREVAAELGAAAGAGEAAWFLQRGFFRICHDLRRSFAVIFMSGSSVAAVYYAPRTYQESGSNARRTDRWPVIRKPLALNRFGFGARGGASGDLVNAASDPRSFVKAGSRACQRRAAGPVRPVRSRAGGDRVCRQRKRKANEGIGGLAVIRGARGVNHDAQLRLRLAVHPAMER